MHGRKLTGGAKAAVVVEVAREGGDSSDARWHSLVEGMTTMELVGEGVRRIRGCAHRWRAR